MDTFCKNESWPDKREIYLAKAKKAFDNGELLESVVHQTKSLSLGFNVTYWAVNRIGGGNNNNNGESTLPSFYPLQNTQTKPPDRLVEYAMKYIKGIESTKTETKRRNNNIMPAIEMPEGTEIQKFCKRLPNEWTVLQICKEYHPDTSALQFDQILRSSQPIYVSLLKHPRSSKYPDPICMKLSASEEDQADLYKEFGELSKDFKVYTVFKGDRENAAEKAEYWKLLNLLETKIIKAIKDLKKFVGPWICLFAGNIKSGTAQQNKIFKAVDQFCDANGLSAQQRVLLSMLCRDVSLLTDKLIKRAAEDLLKENPNPKLQKAIFDFVKSIEFSLSAGYYPCIMIIDEKVDHFYWEALSSEQEFCRVSSFYLLKQLFTKYEAAIKNGYLDLNVKTGSCVVNPEKNLNTMEVRMKAFLEYWLPSYTTIYGQIPTAENLQKMLSKSDCYIYCGHGSGLQFIKGYEITKMETKAVVFLFGCDSVRLRSMGLHSEMYGSHLYYHAALCPAVVGSLVIGLDFQMDKLGTKLLSSWLPSRRKHHWSGIDLKAWKKGEIKPVSDDSGTSQGFKYERSLAAAVAKFRAEKGEKFYNTIGMVYRGLPVWNSTKCLLRANAVECVDDVIVID